MTTTAATSAAAHSSFQFNKRPKMTSCSSSSGLVEDVEEGDQYQDQQRSETKKAPECVDVDIDHDQQHMKKKKAVKNVVSDSNNINGSTSNIDLWNANNNNKEIKMMGRNGIMIIRRRYMECRKNHAANIGGYAVDGCREFMPAGEEGTATAFQCAACHCHRNFHRLMETEMDKEETVREREREREREIDNDSYCCCCDCSSMSAATPS